MYATYDDVDDLTVVVHKHGGCDLPLLSALHLTVVFPLICWDISKLRHPNIVLCVGYMEKGDQLYIITEKLECSLKTLLQTGTDTIPFKEMLSMAIDIARGMLYLHSQKPKIVHADLKVIDRLRRIGVVTIS